MEKRLGAVSPLFSFSSESTSKFLFFMETYISSDKKALDGNTYTITNVCEYVVVVVVYVSLQYTTMMYI